MQKKLIALAVAGLASTAAFAQSNVTLYGVADVYAGSFRATDRNTQNAINSGGLSTSRIGFKGAEDLGNGLKAVFTLEYTLGMDQAQGATGDIDPATAGTQTTTNGSGIGQARQQFVGLSGGFGTAVAGRLQSVGFDFMGATNAFHGSVLNAMDAVNPSVLINSTSRLDNAFAYVSPSFGGVTLAYNHARLTEARNAAANGGGESTANLLSATYANGPLTVSGIVTRVNDRVAAGALTNDDVKEWGVGAAYDFKVVKVLGNYVRSKIADDSNKAWSLSAVVPVTAAGNVVASYARNSMEDSDANSKAYSLAYTHGLSKRTTAYAGYTRVTNDDAAARTTNAGASVIAPTAGGSASGLIAGVRHAF